MPPKKEVTHDYILFKAYELTRKHGFHEISARTLAQELHCSTQPIYHEFADMSHLKNEVAQVAWKNLCLKIQTEKQADLPEIVNTVLHYVHFALEEKNLFQLLIESGVLFQNSVAESFALPNHSLNQKMIIFSNGIILMTAFHTMNCAWEPIQSLILETYEAFRKADGQT